MAAMCFDQTADDRQPEPDALARLTLALPVAIEDMRQIAGRDAAPRVYHRELDAVIEPTRANRHSARPWRELHRVADKIVEHLENAVAIGFHNWKVSGHIAFECETSFQRLLCRRSERVVDDRAHRHGRRHDWKPSD